MIDVTFTKRTLLPWGIVELPTGTYAVRAGEWIDIPKGTTREDLNVTLLNEIPRPEPKPEVTNKRTETFLESSSKGDKKYTVIVFYENEKKVRATCTCVGFSYRGYCKHSDKHMN